MPHSETAALPPEVSDEPEGCVQLFRGTRMAKQTTEELRKHYLQQPGYLERWGTESMRSARTAGTRRTGRAGVLTSS